MINIRLNNDVEMPVLGLGTYPMNRLELLKAIYYARKCGYVSFDTSSAYQNESWLGISLKIMDKILTRDKLFLTTKLSNVDQRKKNVRKALLKSMRKLQVDTVDLYLMHWPNPDTYLESWKQMEEVYKEGLVRAIGVCNFHQSHLEKLLEIASIVPAVNQIELHPLLTQDKIRSYCKEKNIAIEAYSPVARMHPKLIGNKVLQEIALAHGKTVPQVIFRWDIQHNFIVIPKSSSKERIEQNIDVFDFELSDREISAIDRLNENFRVRFDPDTVDFSKV